MNLRDDAMLLCGFVFALDRSMPEPIAAAVGRIMSSPALDAGMTIIPHVIIKPEILHTSVERDQNLNTSEDSNEPAENLENSDVDDKNVVETPGKKIYRTLPPFTAEKEQEAIRLYTVEKYSVKEIAIRLESYDSKVNGVLKAAGVEMRPSAAQLNKAKAQARGSARIDAEETDDQQQPEAAPASNTATGPDAYIPQGFLGYDDKADVEKMLDNGSPKIRVASSYGVTLQELDAFLYTHGSKHKKSDEGQLGNG